MDPEPGLQFQLWKYGFIGKTRPHPIRQVQALLRHRGAEAAAVERWLLLSDLLAEMEDIGERHV